MEAISNAISGRLDLVFFIYGLSFSAMGLLLFVQPRKESSFAMADLLWLLGSFGLLHGGNEFMDMWSIIHQQQAPHFAVIKTAVLITSFSFLFEFGRRSVKALTSENPAWSRTSGLLGWYLLPVLLGLTLLPPALSGNFISAASSLSRLLLGLPGALLSGLAFLGYCGFRGHVLKRLKARNHFLAAGAGFLAYAFLAGLVLPEGGAFPATLLNTGTFQAAVGLPVQLFRAVCAITIFFSIIGALRIFREGALQAAQQELLDIIEFFPDATFVIDKNKKVIAWNRALEKMTGVPKAGMLGKGDFAYAVPFYGVRRPILVDLIGTPDSGADKLYEYVKKRADGAIYAEVFVPSLYGGIGAHVWVTASPLQDKDGAVYGAIESVRDITDRRRAEEALQQSEEQYRALIETTNTGFLIIDQDGRVLDANQEYVRLTGRKSLAEIHGRPVLEWTAEHERKRNADAIEKCARDGNIRNLEIDYAGRDGRVIPVELNATVVNIGGTPRILTLCRDITDRKTAEAGLKAAHLQLIAVNTNLEKRVKERTAQLEEANKELEAFSYSAAHDLKAPLRRVNVFAEMLEKEAGAAMPGGLKDYLLNIRKSAKQMTDLVEGLLKLSTTGRKPLDLQKVPLSPLLAEAIAEIKAEIPGRQVEWTAAPLPEVECDRSMIKQVFINLLGNAAKYSRGSSPAVIAVSCALQNGEHVIGVRDNGVGFSMEYYDRLFGVFQRLHKAEEFEGTGIGLSTVRRIVTRHGGRVWAESAPGKGAVFYFSLPAAP